jgi:hypothetical protein
MANKKINQNEGGNSEVRNRKRKRKGDEQCKEN